MNRKIKDNTNKTKKELVELYGLDPNMIKQVFLIGFINCSVYDYFDLLDTLGDYRTGSIAINDENKDYAYINTKYSIKDIEKKINKVKEKDDNISIIGLTFDMMSSIEDYDDKIWCYDNQKENMDYILSKTQKNSVEFLNSILDAVEEETEKIIAERNNKK